jgi:hypothetical protein
VFWGLRMPGGACALSVFMGVWVRSRVRCRRTPRGPLLQLQVRASWASFVPAACCRQRMLAAPGKTLKAGPGRSVRVVL